MESTLFCVFKILFNIIISCMTSYLNLVFFLKFLRNIYKFPILCPSPDCRLLRPLHRLDFGNTNNIVFCKCKNYEANLGTIFSILLPVSPPSFKYFFQPVTSSPCTITYHFTVICIRILLTH